MLDVSSVLMIDSRVTQRTQQERQQHIERHQRRGRGCRRHQTVVEQNDGEIRARETAAVDRHLDLDLVALGR